MRVVRLRSPDELVIEEADRPGAEALVRVHAAAITRGELEWPLDRLPAVPTYRRPRPPVKSRPRPAL